ncbi:heavy metal-associated domain-containing protein [Clostridium sp.]|uniref:heavy-metal-associated domain-containing protein n=1 Tax=Clostridium sp. TaxID=1506 RepID=UPI001DD94A42|nr:heavy metal-associated domain-containing protein [Clostridium sp.]MBS5986259.1 heavy-metal-associated domain-containing protein [Clostridium sp.]
MNRVHYEVNNLVNSTSKTQLKNALDKVEGVQNVCVDMARGTVEVIYSGEANESKIKNCIEDSGFNVE